MAFISVWSVPFGGTNANRTVILPIISGTMLNNITVDWGDSSNNNYNNFQVTDANRPSRIYALGGERTITITGTGQLSGWSFREANVTVGTPTLLKSIAQYGNLQIANTGSQFFNCTNLLTFPLEGTLILTSNCNRMFMNCSNLNTDLNTLDTTHVTTMAEMFVGCSRFNGNISNWTVSRVTSMNNIFTGCTAFRKDISQWILTGIINNQAPTFSTTYINNVRPLFSTQYPNAWKFNLNNNNNLQIINIITDDLSFLYTIQADGDNTSIRLLNNPCISTWTTNINRIVILPIILGTYLPITVNWGDTQQDNYDLEEVTNENRPSHEYASDGDKTITITGQLSGWSFGDGLGTPALLKSITQYGGLQLADTGSQFFNCTNLETFPQTGTLLLPVNFNCSSMFNGCIKLNTNLNTLDTRNVTRMDTMFFGCFVFNGNISNWNVDLVEDMSAMFLNCSRFTGEQLFTINQGTPVTSMTQMFSGCTDFIGNSNLSNWNVQSVQDMFGMFSNCEIFTGNFIFNLTGGSQLLNTSNMFTGALLFNGNISNWNVNQVNDMRAMFLRCNAFRSDISNWVLTGIHNNQAPTFSINYIDAVKPLFSAEYPASWKFNRNVSLNTPTGILNTVIPAGRTHLYRTIEETDQNGNLFTRLERKPFDSTWTVTAANTNITLPIVTNANANISIRVDWGDGTLEDVNTVQRPTHSYAAARPEPYTISISGRINGWSFANLSAGDISRSCFTSITSYGCLLDIGNTGSQFKDCANLQAFPQTETLPLPANCSQMFNGCIKLSTSLTTLNTIDVTTMANMFSGCLIFNGNISNWIVQRVQDMSGMFANCRLFTGANLFALSTGSAVKNMSGMFSECRVFTGNNNLFNWKVQLVEDMSGMFFNCLLFTGANLFALSTGSAVINMSNMFSECRVFTGNNNLFNWNVQLVEDMSDMFFNCLLFTGANLFALSTGSAVKNMSGMFSECRVFTGNNNLFNWKVQLVEDMSGMFFNCLLFTGANIFALLDGSAVIDMSNMFVECSQFTGNNNLFNWDVQLVEDITGMFFNCENFNGDISNWNVQRVHTMTNIFANCNAFKKDISKWVLTGITTNVGAPSFSTEYIDEVNPKFSSAYPASWKFTPSANLNKDIIDTILPDNRKDMYYIDDALRLRLVEKDASVSVITGSGNSSIKYAYNSRIKVFF